MDSQKDDLKMESWILKLDMNAKVKLVSRFLQVSNGILTVKEIYLTDVALAVHFRMHSYEYAVKEAVSSILQLLSNYAEQQGIAVPIIGVISLDTQAENSDIEKEVEKWAADQDWHRGDFSLFYSSAKQAEELIHSLLSDAEVVWREEDKFKPLTSKEYLQKLKSKLEGLESTPEHKELIKTIIRSWEKEDSIENAVKEWTDIFLSEIDQLAGEGGE